MNKSDALSFEAMLVEATRTRPARVSDALASHDELEAMAGAGGAKAGSASPDDEFAFGTRTEPCAFTCGPQCY